MTKTINTRLQLKKDTAANWEKNNPILLNGEKILVVTNAGEIREKIGDGSKTYTQLPFTDESLRTLISDKDDSLKALISNKVDKVSGKDLSTNDYTTAEKNKLKGIEAGANKYVHPESHPATMIVEDATHRFVTNEEKIKWDSNSETVVSSTANGLMSKEDKIKLDTIAEGANKYVHPSYTAKASGLYKITVDATGHVSAATTVAKADITGLGIPAQDTTYPTATTSVDGLMTSTMVSKLNGIADGANKYVHPSYTAKSSGFYKVTVDTTGHVSAVANVTKEDITGLGVPAQDTTYSDMGGATASANGSHGLVPAPEKGEANRYLRSDGTWVVPPDTNTTYDDATTSTHGLMTAAMVTKLNSIADNANNTVVDSALSTTSVNPVQNKVINTALAGKSNTGHTHTKAEITDFPESLKNPTALTIQLNGTSQGAYDGSAAKTVNITASSVGAATASHTHNATDIGADTAGAADAALVSAKSYTDSKISDLINGAPETLDTLGEIATAMNDNKDVVSALQTAVGTKADSSALTSHTGNATVHITANERTAWNAKASTAIATTTANGLMSKDDKSKLDGIATGANKYVHPSYTAKTSGFYKVTVDATGHVSAVTNVTKDDITGLGIPGKDTTYPGMIGATANTDGVMGLVPVPAKGAANRYLRSDGAWQVPPDTNTTYSDATTSAHGLMTAAMVSKLNGIAAGANNYTHPTYTAKSTGFYKIAVDASGHVSVANAVTKTDITGLGIPAQDTTYSDMGGATADAAGARGLVPAPAKGAANRYLRSDGTWQVPPDTNTTYPVATASADGLMSSADKSNLTSLLSRVSALETSVTSLTNKLKTAVFYE